MRKLIIILVLVNSYCFSQINENFVDGKYTSNPAWQTNNANLWTIDQGNFLRSNLVTTITSTNYYISTPSSRLNETQWEFFCQLKFTPNSSNYVDVFLLASEQNLINSSLLGFGYFIKLGNTTQDICLYRKNKGMSVEKLIDGNDNMLNSTNNQVKIKVIRTNGLWYLYADVLGTGENYQLIGSFSEPITTISGSSFGFLIKQSSAVSPQKNHFFRNIYVGDIDISPPSISAISITGANTLEVLFSEPVSLQSSTLVSNFIVNNQITYPILAKRKPNNQTISLTFSGSFLQNTLYNISISGISDWSNNVLTLASSDFILINFIPPVTISSQTLNYKDLNINELMIDPTPIVGLPNVEYVELYNSTNQTINLKDFTLVDGNVNRKFNSNTTINGGGFLVICNNTSSKLLLESIIPGIHIVTLSGFGLTDAGETLILKDSNGKIVDKVTYKNSFFRDASKVNGGYALELINPKIKCNSYQNWNVARNLEGGTPGKANSILDTNFNFSTPEIVQTKIESDRDIRIIFNNNLDSNTVLTNSFLSNELPIENRSIKGENADTVLLRFQNPMLDEKIYHLTILGLSDCVGNKLQTTEISFGKGVLPKKNEIVINEIYVDVSPSNGLPNSQFIEIYNPTEKYFDISGFKIFDGNTIGKIPPNVKIKPKSYLIVCSSSQFNSYIIYGETIGITNFPSLNLSNQTIQLLDANGMLIHRVFYSDTWYRDTQKKMGGWSLEMIDAKNPCGAEQNWNASINNLGGTPGKKNSVASANPDVLAPALSNYFALSSDTLLLNFNENIDSISVFSSKIRLEPDNTFLNMIIGKDYLKLIPVNHFEAQKRYSIQLNGIKDCVGNILKDNQLYPFYLAEKPNLNDIILNEIIFNPKPNGFDFIELYNRSDKYINLKKFQIANLNSSTGKADNFVSITDDDFLLKPHSFLVVSQDILKLKNDFPKSSDATMLQTKSFPSFNDDEGTFLLFDHNGTQLERFDYQEKYHFKLIKDVQGVSLERIDINKATNLIENWTSAASTENYATPGYVNSQSKHISDLNLGGVEIEPSIITPNNDGRDDFAVLNLKTEGNGKIGTILIFDVLGNQVRLLAQNRLLANESIFIWDGLNDNQRTIKTGCYMLVIEIEDMNGDKKIFKKSVVVANF
jgi:hypothetical protein